MSTGCSPGQGEVYAASPLPLVGDKTSTNFPLPLAGDGPSTNSLLPLVGEGRGRGQAERAQKARTLARAKSLRTNQTDAEARLWYHLRAHRFMGLKFRRQKPVGRYIVDFVCWAQRLIIELDGGQHAEGASHDRQRDAWLRSQGYTVLRFWNHEVMQELEGVLEGIRRAVSTGPSPLAPPPQVGEGNDGVQQS
ncbi:MAG: endonuclease domain-containing protein [Gammaproteobacteria bacterium]